MDQSAGSRPRALPVDHFEGAHVGEVALRCRMEGNSRKLHIKSYKYFIFDTPARRMLEIKCSCFPVFRSVLACSSEVQNLQYTRQAWFRSC